MRNISIYIGFLVAILLGPLILQSQILAEEPPRIKIGFTITLTGDGAVAGAEIKNAALLANELLLENRYQLLFEDEKCSAKDATTAAKKFIEFEKINYASGFYCNTALLGVSHIYSKANIPIVSIGASTGDVVDVGKNVYRLAPADHQSIDVLYPYVAKRFKSVAVIAEEDAFAQLLKKYFVLVNNRSAAPLDTYVEDFQLGETDFRSLLTKVKTHKVDAIFTDTATEATFIRMVRQMRELGMKQPIFGVYMPISSIAMKELGSLLNGTVGATLPDLEKSIQGSKGRELRSEYIKRYGETKSGTPVVPTIFEAMRLFNEVRVSGRSLEEIIKDPVVMSGSFLGHYTFDTSGAIQGLQFILKEVRDGELVEVVG